MVTYTVTGLPNGCTEYLHGTQGTLPLRLGDSLTEAIVLTFDERSRTRMEALVSDGIVTVTGDRDAEPEKPAPKARRKEKS